MQKIKSFLRFLINLPFANDRKKPMTLKPKAFGHWFWLVVLLQLLVQLIKTRSRNLEFLKSVEHLDENATLQQYRQLRPNLKL